MANPCQELKEQFTKELEEVLQCPVCLDILDTPVSTCLQGHSMCSKCQNRMTKCPLCKYDFIGARNYLAESLITKYKEIKKSTINPYSNQNNTKMVHVETQTDTNAKIGSTPFITDINQNDKKPSDIYPAVGKGLYPCKIGNCFIELAHGRMIPHIRFYHKETLLEEKLVESGKYELEWEVCNTASNYDRAINISNMGLFFFNITVDNDGDLYGNVQIVSCNEIAKKFNYMLTLKNSNTNVNYSGQVLSCRATEQKIKKKCFYINNKYLSHLMGKKNSINGLLTLTFAHEKNEK